MTYTAVAIVFVLVCVWVGARWGGNAATTRVAAGAAVAMLAAQLYLLALR